MPFLCIRCARREDSAARVVAALFVALLLATACPLWIASAQTAARDSICALARDADRAYVAHNRGFLTSLFAEEFVHTNFRRGTIDKEGEIDFFTSPDLTMEAASIDTCAARVYNETAVATGINTWTHALYKGGDLSGACRFTRVYVRRDARWQVVASHFSKIAP